MSKYLESEDGTKLRYKKDKVDNPRGILVINHGFAEHLGRYDHVSKRFNDEGFTVYRYDLRGHGKTKSEKGHIDSYEDFIEDCNSIVELAIKENENLPIYMLGHSMGGLVTCMYGIVYPDKLKGQIFSGPAVDTVPAASGIRSVGIKTLNKLAPNMKIKNVVEDDICSVEEVVDDYKNDPLVLEEATVQFYHEFTVSGTEFIRENIHKYKYPCLITHGEEDTIVPVDIGYYLYDNISSKDKEIKVYEDLYHEILNEDEKDEVLDDMIEWIEKRI